jgi:hypothetical protein
LKDILEGFKVSSSVGNIGISSTERKMEAACKSLPDNELVTMRQLAARMNLSVAHVQAYATSELLKDHRCKLGFRYLWGNKKTIEKLRARLPNGH